MAGTDLAGHRVLIDLVHRERGAVARHRCTLGAQVRKHEHHHLRVGQQQEDPFDLVGGLLGEVVQVRGCHARWVAFQPLAL